MGAGSSRSMALDDVCRLRAKQLEEAMKNRHGGDWNISFDAKHRFVLISR
jgi:hypothetical protein